MRTDEEETDGQIKKKEGMDALEMPLGHVLTLRICSGKGGAVFCHLKV